MVGNVFSEHVCTTTSVSRHIFLTGMLKEEGLNFFPIVQNYVDSFRRLHIKRTISNAITLEKDNYCYYYYNYIIPIFNRVIM